MKSPNPLTNGALTIHDLFGVQQSIQDKAYVSVSNAIYFLLLDS